MFDNSDLSKLSESHLKGLYWLLWRLLNSSKCVRNILSSVVTVLLYLSYRTRLYHRISDVFPSKTQREIRKIAWESTKESCFQIIHSMSAPEYQYRIVGEEVLLSITDTGAVCASLHIGQVEAPTYAIQKAGYPVCTVIGQGRTNSQLNFLGKSMLEKINIPYVVKGGYVFFKLVGRLRRKECVFIHSDLRGKGLNMDFFGKKTTVPKTAASLAVLTKVPLLFTYGIQEGNNVTIYITELAGLEEISVQEKDREHLVALLTQRLVVKMEQVISEYPERWCWLYNRFKIK